MRTGVAKSDRACGWWFILRFWGNHGRQDPQPIYEVVSSIIILALCLWICGLTWCEGWSHTLWKYATKIPSFRAHETNHKWACVCSILTCTFNVVCSSFQFTIGCSLEKVKVVMGVLDEGHLSQWVLLADSLLMRGGLWSLSLNTLRNIWVCHSPPILAMPSSWQSTKTKLSSYGGVQNCGRLAVLKAPEWRFRFRFRV